MLLAIQHETRYQPDPGSGPRIQRLRLTPRQEASQVIANWTLDVPGPTQTRRDAHGNMTHWLTLGESAEEIVLRVNGLVETEDEAVVGAENDLPLAVYLAATQQTQGSAELTEFARDCLSCEPDPVYGLFDLMTAVRRQVPNLSCISYAGGSAAEAFAFGAGSMEDLAHVYIAACRTVGIPARYVSGYVHTGPQTPVASHVWSEAWVNDLGWIGFDITNNRTTDGRLCKLAIGRDHSEACPVASLHSGGGREVIHN